MHYHNHIGVAFRFYKKEKLGLNYEKHLYITEFLKIYTENEKYVIVSDDNCFVEDLKHLKNVSFIVPDYFINNTVSDSESVFKQRKNRSENTLLTLQSAYALSTCKYVYRTAGGFSYLARLFNKDLEIKNLID